MTKINSIIILVAAAFFQISTQGQTSTSYIANSAIPSPPGIGGGNSCVGFGYGALGNGNAAPGNSAAGFKALQMNYIGEHNTASGDFCLGTNYAAAYNTGAGSDCLKQNGSTSAGKYNAAAGYRAMYLNIDGDHNTAAGWEALVNNQYGINNTAIGCMALNDNQGISTPYGDNNTAVGAFSLRYNNNGRENTAVGFGTLYNIKFGSQNSAIGYRAGWGNLTQAQGNTIAGYKAMDGFNWNGSNISGSNNTAIGSEALSGSTEGQNNTAVGYQSMYACDNCYLNTGFGSYALYKSNNSSFNVAIGNCASYNASTTWSQYNTSIGNYALYTTIGYDNTAVGHQAGANYTQDYGNTSIGALSDIQGTYHNSSAIGTSALASADNMVMVGNMAVTKIAGSPLNYTGSDVRFKEQVRETDVKGLEFVKKLNPVVYNLETEKLHNFFDHPGKMTDTLGSKQSIDYSQSKSIRRSGFIAQEVLKVARETKFDFDAIHSKESDSTVMSLSYGSFVVPLVKAVQEQQLQIEQENEALLNLEQKYEVAKTKLNSGNATALEKRLYSGEVTLDFSNLSQQDLQVTILDFNGNLVHSAKKLTGDRQCRIPSDTIKPGIYICTVSTPETILKSELFVFLK